MLVYKIFRAAEWAQLARDGSTAGAPVDLADGFIHLSIADQLPATAAKHFHAEDDLTLAAVGADALGDALKWEPSRGGALFPHLYRALRIDDIAWSAPLPWRDGAHHFPAGLT
ncbi:DUF952 domain-containing protein [Sediminimonas sp.]|uniref:DUF952 domain-containing protein n=1 Tax=Sediminimonas sp. TaxID=2823379 RepID=UPI0025FBD63C|nr:DUF952 domain-containing protein [Sediminimonas sp.]